MRIVTRGDLDGLSCALILTACEKVDVIELVHPQEISERRFQIRSDDIVANLPYHPKCAMWFDNHLLTDKNATPPRGFVGRYAQAPSAARVVYDHYLPDHPELKRFEPLLADTDRFDSAQLTLDDIIAPKGYILLAYTLDPRTGLGAFQEYFHLLLSAFERKTLHEVLRLPDVQERVQRMREQDRAFRDVTLAHSRMEGTVVVTDFRPLTNIPVGNRFLVYTLFPEANLSVRIHWNPRRDGVIVSVGRSILNRSSRANVGVLLSMFGGGGHAGAGSCQLTAVVADARIQEILGLLKRR
jgi:oligoribonuclease NrnB/cAMP/cGMP phosphodiesterase (DHH superfamily)